MNLKELFGNLKDIESIREKFNEKLSEIHVDSEVGGGMVRMRVNGKKTIEKLIIDDSLMTVENKEMLCDLIIASHFVANRKVEEKVSELNMENSLDFLPSLEDLLGKK